MLEQMKLWQLKESTSRPIPSAFQSLPSNKLEQCLLFGCYTCCLNSFTSKFSPHFLGPCNLVFLGWQEARRETCEEIKCILNKGKIYISSRVVIRVAARSLVKNLGTSYWQGYGKRVHYEANTWHISNITTIM
jgi:hypothetical protein